MTTQPTDLATKLAEEIGRHLAKSDAGYAADVAYIAEQFRKVLEPMERDHAAMEAMRSGRCDICESIGGKKKPEFTAHRWGCAHSHDEDPAVAILIAAKE